MDILMIVHTMGTLDPSDNDRFTYLAQLLMSEGHDIEIVTSDFEHHKKSYRDTKAISQKYPFKITFLHEDAYKKNISIQRIVGHISFAKRLKKYLEKRKRPDVIYCAIPPTVSADYAARYAEKNKVRFVVDVQDLWPESFVMALGDNVISRCVLGLIAVFADGTYERANAIVAVSNTFLRRAERKNQIADKKCSVYLGVDRERVICSTKERVVLEKARGEFWICYVGNIARSYDFENVFKALQIVKNKGITNIRFIVVGDGDLRQNVEKMANDYGQKVLITGYLPYQQMFSYLKQADIAINPIAKNSVSSVINKVGDYAAAAVPVVNTQDSEEYRNLLELYSAGLNTIPEDAQDIAEKILYLYKNPEKAKQMGMNNGRLFQDKFDRHKTYEEIVKCITRKTSRP